MSLCKFVNIVFLGFIIFTKFKTSSRLKCDGWGEYLKQSITKYLRFLKYFKSFEKILLTSGAYAHLLLIM